MFKVDTEHYSSPLYIIEEIGPRIHQDILTKGGEFNLKAKINSCTQLATLQLVEQIGQTQYRVFKKIGLKTYNEGYNDLLKVINKKIKILGDK